MGCGQSSPEIDEASRSIDRQLEKEKQLRNRTSTIFLTGTGESGKSTVLKQMRALWGDPIDSQERVEYRSVVLSNVLQSMVVILEAMMDFGIGLGNQEEEDWSRTIQAVPGMVDYLTADAVRALAGLWQTQAVQKTLLRASEFQLNDSAPYFFQNLPRLTSPDYLPSDADILHARVRTTGIIETCFGVKRDRFYKVIDVGGQRSERRKWIACFEHVDALLFLFATSEFDQVLYEDETTNRFVEAEQLFSSITNSMWFKKSTLVVFLNKIDLFAVKIRTTPLSHFLPEFQGPDTPEAGLTYIRERVLSYHKGHAKPYCHLTCATDTKSISFILTAVHDQIVSSLLKESHLV